MPQYDYACHQCGGRESQIRRIEERDSPVKCSKCGAEMERQFTPCAGFRPFPAGWWDDIASKPLYIEDQGQLRDACEKHGVYSHYLDG